MTDFTCPICAALRPASFLPIFKCKDIGNLSNPSINRWGLNLFWYNFWFTDKNHQKMLHLDYIINKLIYLYIFYGLFLKKTMFSNHYWYDTEFDKEFILNFRANHFSNYFRVMEFKNRIRKEISYFRVRTRRKHIYISKLWILKYQKWLIINFYCFQPIKVKWHKRVKPRRDKSLISTNPKHRRTISDLSCTLIKNKFLLQFFTNFFISNSKYFYF